MGGSSLSSTSSTFFLPGPGKLRVLSHPISTVSGWFLHLSRQIKHTGSTFKGKMHLFPQRGVCLWKFKDGYIWLGSMMRKRVRIPKKNAWGGKECTLLLYVLKSWHLKPSLDIPKSPSSLISCWPPTKPYFMERILEPKICLFTS